ncbi:hypothetical protein ABKN59_007754 [Abortiporus biennis]
MPFATLQDTVIIVLWEVLHWTRIPRLLILSKHRKRIPIPLSTAELTSEELLRIYATTSRIDDDSSRGLTTRPIKLVAPDAIMKVGNELEMINTQFILSKTTIPVPICDRVVHCGRSDYLVLEYIPGRTLYSCWSELGWWTRLRVFITLREYVRQLRFLTHSRPGPIGPDNRPQICIGPLFGEKAGSFEDKTTFAAFFNRKYDVTKRYRPRYVANVEKPFDDSGPLVYTHLDLNMQNIILGDDGQLWLIDWDFAGYYPIWFENAGMQVFSDD